MCEHSRKTQAPSSRSVIEPYRSPLVLPSILLLLLQGISRFKIVDGWISQRLRTPNAEQVFVILRELPAAPVPYRVIRSGGAKLREGVGMDR